MDFNHLLSWIHIATSVLSLLTGALVLFSPKGTPQHRRIGYVFAAGMLVVNLSAAGMYNLTGRINFLHGFILLSLFSLTYGLLAARRRRPGWLRRHISGMNGAAIGVWAAGLAELTVRVLPFYLGPAAIQWVAGGIGLLAFLAIFFSNYYYQRRWSGTESAIL